MLSTSFVSSSMEHTLLDGGGGCFRVWALCQCSVKCHRTSPRTRAQRARKRVRKTRTNQEFLVVKFYHFFNKFIRKEFALALAEKELRAKLWRRKSFRVRAAARHVSHSQTRLSSKDYICKAGFFMRGTRKMRYSFRGGINSFASQSIV